jgi:multidrug efflux pump subunit AcrB
MLALLVVFMVLASQFESLLHPFTVLLAVPLAVTGALVVLKLAGSTINLYSQIGMILLIGLVTKNSILLVEYANQLQEKGLNPVEAMLEAGRIRLRPILMTSVATITSAVPIALGLGAGSISRRPLGYAIVGRRVLLHRSHSLPRARGLHPARSAPPPKEAKVPAVAPLEEVS